MENAAFRSFLHPLSYLFPSNPLNALYLRQTSKQENLPTTLYFNVQDMRGKLTQQRFQVLLSELFKDRIGRNEHKPQKVVRGSKGKCLPFVVIKHRNRAAERG